MKPVETVDQARHWFQRSWFSGQRRVVASPLPCLCSHLQHINFMAHTRLEPIKTTSIPILELSTAVLAVISDTKLRRKVSIPLKTSVFWTDNMIVLHYIVSFTRQFHTFVANRLELVHRLSSSQQ